jgi:peptidoglycan/LPS O-acetylase OafA/YrhL
MLIKRIEVLDSFRGIAILMVIFFHFFSRWTNFYPYGTQYDFFNYGKYGVHFFFMISGFVILFTLESTKCLSHFWFNRFIRLLPSMFFASLITYVFFKLFDNELLFPTSHSLKNLFVSITFIQPDLLSSLTNYKIQLDYISASYWSLWIEIQFYVLASFIYFISKYRFKIFFFTTTILLVILNFILSNVYSSSIIIMKAKSLRNIFNLSDGLPFFCLGAVFYFFYKNNQLKIINKFWEYSLFLFFTLFLFYKNYNDYKKIILISFFIFLFMLMIYIPKYLIFFNIKFLNIIGVSSYFLYLIHENIGVFLIHKNYLFLKEYSFILPIFYILFLITFSIIYTKYIELKIIDNLKRMYK